MQPTATDCSLFSFFFYSVPNIPSYPQYCLLLIHLFCLCMPSGLSECVIPPALSSESEGAGTPEGAGAGGVRRCYSCGGADSQQQALHRQCWYVNMLKWAWVVKLFIIVFNLIETSFINNKSSWLCSVQPIDIQFSLLHTTRCQTWPRL